MKRIGFGVALLAAAGTTAVAASPPHFDTEGYCRMDASRDGPLLQSKLDYTSGWLL